MTDPQTTLFIVSITGAIGWILTFIFFARDRRHKTKLQILTADHKALKEAHDRVSSDLKNLQHRTVEPFQNKTQRTKSEGYAFCNEEQSAPKR